MKRLAFILPILLTLSLFSCKKEEVEPDLGINRVAYPTEFATGYEIDNKTFRLISGKMYMENMETGNKVVYDHFDENQTISSMNYGGIELEIEKLEVNVTTWGFYSTDRLEFRVNGDSIDVYECTQNSFGMSIIDHGQSSNNGPITHKLNGSSKPFRIEHVGNDVIQVYINESYVTINNEQYSYFNELYFELVK